MKLFSYVSILTRVLALRGHSHVCVCFIRALACEVMNIYVCFTRALDCEIIYVYVCSNQGLGLKLFICVCISPGA